MGDQYEIHVKVEAEAPAREWHGTLFIEIDSDKASGNLQLPTQYPDPIPFTSNKVSFQEMDDSTFVTASGSNSNAEIELGFFLMTNDYGETVVYLGGMMNLLDYEVREWIPYLISGFVHVES